MLGWDKPKFGDDAMRYSRIKFNSGPQLVVTATLVAMSVLSLAGSSAIAAPAKAAPKPAAAPATKPTTDAPKYPYGADMVAEYVDACSSAGNGSIPAETMKSICTCTIEVFQNTYTLKEFTKIGQAIESGKTKEIPPEMTTITEDCVKQTLLKPNT
jgi:hypothetical protein